MSEPQWSPGPPPNDENWYHIRYDCGLHRSHVGNTVSGDSHVIAHYGPIPDYEPPTPLLVRRFVWGNGLVGCYFGCKVAEYEFVGIDEKGFETRGHRCAAFPNFRWLDDEEGNQLPRGGRCKKLGS